MRLLESPGADDSCGERSAPPLETEYDVDELDDDVMAINKEIITHSPYHEIITHFCYSTEMTSVCRFLSAFVYEFEFLLFSWTSGGSPAYRIDIVPSITLSTRALTPCSLKYSPHALQTGSPSLFRLHNVVVDVWQFAHDNPTLRDTDYKIYNYIYIPIYCMTFTYPAAATGFHYGLSKPCVH